MKLSRADGALAIEFEGGEWDLFAVALRQTRDEYAADYANLPERLQRYWQGTLSVEGADRLAAEAEDLRETRLAWRSERLKALDRWVQADGLPRLDTQGRFRVSGAEIPDFLAILNDRRLALAALHAVGDAEMEIHPTAVVRPELRQALWEIHFLGYILEVCLREIEEGN